MSFAYSGGDDDDEPEYDAQQDEYANEQQNSGAALQQTQGERVQQEILLPENALFALWETGPEQSAPSGGAPADLQGRSGKSGRQAESGLAAQRRGGAGRAGEYYRQEDREEEDEDDRRERRLLEERQNFAKDLLSDFKIETIGAAYEYCDVLIKKQIERAENTSAPMNEAVYGDGHARRAITTLLPDVLVRELFLKVTRDQKAWPRLRPLFGAPPYVFLNPGDAGLVRAAGVSTGRSNMTYDRAGETAAYSQFGSGHLVDEYLREYKVLPAKEPSAEDNLPFDMQKVAESQYLFMNVRVPKRSRQEKISLLKDQSTRRAVVFPFVGEVLKVRYSAKLKRVWGQKLQDDATSQVVVRRLVPRAANAATAAVLGVKI